MKLKRVLIENYRSCLRTSIDLHPNLSVLIGPNGSGKTNILQAIMLLNKLAHDEEEFPPRDYPFGISSGIKALFVQQHAEARLNATVYSYTDHSNKDKIVRSRQKWRLKGQRNKRLSVEIPMGGSEFLVDNAMRGGQAAEYYEYRIKVLLGPHFKVPPWARRLVASTSRYCRGIIYYGASQFTNPGSCPASFEIDKGKNPALYDLDVHNEQELRALLTRAITPVKAKASVVLIPKREIEAWLLYDRDAIAKAFREADLLKLPGDPESLLNPKAHLRDLIWAKYRKRYLHTVHNSQIAKYIDVVFLRRSKSFAPHFAFAEAARKMIR
jgi:energy-coupling factor transporter ATP-binding protein EcfA2